MPTEAKTSAAYEAYKLKARARQTVYNNFHYTDAQREQLIEFIAAAMKVIRGEATFDTLTKLSRIEMTLDMSASGESYRGGKQYFFNTDFLNEWMRIYAMGTSDPKTSRIDAYLFRVDFDPEMNIPRERLEQLLQLKTAPGWTADGGNLQYEVAQLHGLPDFNGGVFEYAPLEQPQADFNIQVLFTYLNGPDKNPYTARRLVRLKISRDYLTPEEIKQRNDKKLGHLPQTGERAPKDGRYMAMFADDALTASIPLDQRMQTFGEGHWLGPAYVRNPATGRQESVHAWWHWVGPDPFADELARLFPSNERQRPG